MIKIRLQLSLAIVVVLVGCDSSNSNSQPDPDPDPVGDLLVGGGGVKGPLIGAEVNLYELNLGAENLLGAQIDTGVTGADANIEDLTIGETVSGLVVLEFIVNAGTTDLTTGAAPIFDRLVTIVDAQRLLDGDDVYASVLTTMAVNLAIAKADSGSPYSGNGDGNISEAELNAALITSQNQVVSTLGFGLSSDIDIFTTSPLITDSTTTTESQEEVAAYRQAIEAVAAIANEIAEDIGGGSSAQDVFDALIDDLSDGDIDGEGSDGAVATLATVVGTLSATVTQDASTLVIPGTTVTVGDIEGLLADETTTTGTSTDVTALETGNIDVTPEPGSVVVDSDLDGTTDDVDAFPMDATETTDTDADGVGDNSDAFPEDATETVDTDSDGVGDNADVFPGDASETLDTDADGVGDNADAFPEDDSETADTDDDGVGNNADAFPTDANETTDTDADGVGDNADIFPEDASETTDTDDDGVGNNADAFPTDASETTDTDGDGVGDNADAFPNDTAETVDTDEDGVGDNADAFPSDATETADTDGDGVGDNADAFPDDANEISDGDGDGVGDNSDNCVADANSDQSDEDNDGVGNVCDDDSTGSDPTAVWDQFNWDEAVWQ